MMNRLFSWLILSILSAACHAEPATQPQTAITSDWRSECVGRYQVNVPGEVEVALISDLKMNNHSNGPFYKFSDGSRASFSSGTEVSRSVSSEEFIQFRSKYLEDQEILKRKLIEKKDVIANTFTISNSKTSLFQFFGIRTEDYAENFLYANQHLFYYYGSDENAQFIKHGLLSSFHPRALYEIPSQPGVCFPYGFIADDGKAPRNIAVTMRLVDHPDVEVFFKDSSDSIGKADDTAEDDLKWFWTMMYNRYAKTATMDSRGFRNITMDNHKGTGLFVTLTRYDQSTYHGKVALSLGAPADGSTDYGYAAIVNGDPKTNTPGQMIYVIRTASRAIAKGIQPVSKEQIKDIAEQMMASIKRHPE